jgi:hypothetical protein
VRKFTLSAASILLLSTLPAIALEPLMPPGNFEGVCGRIPEIKALAKKMISAGSDASNASELQSEFANLLYGLAYGAETRLTVDGDDIEDPLGASEVFVFHLGELTEEEKAKDLRASIRRFAAIYGCKA